MTEKTIGKNESGQRFDKYLAKLMPKAPKSFFYKMLRKKNIVLNGRKAAGNESLKEGDVVRLYLSDETFSSFCPEPTARSYKGPLIPVVYEGHDILVLNKPSGLLSQGDRSGKTSCADFVRHYLLETGALSREDLAVFHPAPVNRLDRNTSGLILCGKSLKGEQVLSELIRKRQLEKYYLTVVSGDLQEEGLFRAYAKKDPKANILQVSDVPKEGWSEILTGIEVLDRKADHSLLRVRLVTGKSHQIRAHLAHLGHPVAGDKKYGYRGALQKTLNSQLLHAAELHFPERVEALPELSGLVLKAAPDKTMTDTLEKLGFHLKT